MAASELRGKVVVLTGAAGGIGKALAKAFVDAGMKVAALDQDERGVKELEKTYGSDAVFAAKCDVSDPESCRRAVDAVIQHFKTINILVNNAALGMNAVHKDYERGELQIEDVSEALWARFMSVNVNGPYNMARAVVPILRKQKWGRIVNISTSYLTMMRKGFAPYGPAKAAVEAWTMMLSRQLEGTGITANIVLPGGPVDTAMVVDFPGLDRSTLLSPNIMSPVILALFSNAGDKLTGQRYVAVDWDAKLGDDPEKQPHRQAAWPELARPLASTKK